MTWEAAIARAHGLEPASEEDSWQLAAVRAQQETDTRGRSTPKSRPDGRPRGHVNTPIDWALGTRMFIQGTTVDGVLRWPSFSFIADALNVNDATVANHAKKHRWLERKEKIRKELQDSEDMDIVNSRKNSTRSPLEVVEAIIDKFDAALRADELVLDDVTQLATAVKLRDYMIANAARPSTVNAELSLETLQERHRAHRRVEHEALSDESSGVLTHGEAIVGAEGEGHVTGAPTKKKALDPATHAHIHKGKSSKRVGVAANGQTRQSLEAQLAKLLKKAKR